MSWDITVFFSTKRNSIETFKIILFEDEKITKSRALLKGVKDYKELL